MNKCVSLCAGVIIFASFAPARADLAPPPPRQQSRVVVPVVVRRGAIRGEGRSIEAKLVIPRSLLPNLGPEQPISAPAPKQPGDYEVKSTTPPLGSVVAGLAMSLAAVSMIFVVRGSRATKTAALIVIGGAMLATGFGIAQADVVPSRRVPNQPYIPPPAPAPAPAPPRNANQGEIVIEFTDNGEAVTLLLAR